MSEDELTREIDVSASDVLDSLKKIEIVARRVEKLDPEAVRAEANAIIADVMTKAAERRRQIAEGLSDDDEEERAAIESEHEDGAAALDDESKPPRVWSPASVVESWASEGPLVHLPTGFPTLDERTGGGPVRGSRVYVLGAPDAGKTAFFAQLADGYIAQGCAVGYLSVDEEPSDLVTRFLQRRRWHRRDCEERAAEHMPRMLDDARAIDLRIYDAEHTLESAAADLERVAEALKRTPVLFVDSLQSVAHMLAGERVTERAAVTSLVHAIRRAAVRRRMLIVVASEMNRGGYGKDSDPESDMTAAKESGAIEYGARVLLSLRATGEDGVVRVSLPKNKLGPKGAPFFVALNASTMTFEETQAPEQKSENVKASKRTESVREIEEVADAIVKIAIAKPGIGAVDLRAQVKALGLGGKDKVAAGVALAIDRGQLANRSERVGQRDYPHYFAVSPSSDGEGYG